MSSPESKELLAGSLTWETRWDTIDKIESNWLNKQSREEEKGKEKRKKKEKKKILCPGYWIQTYGISLRSRAKRAQQVDIDFS